MATGDPKLTMQWTIERRMTIDRDSVPTGDGEADDRYARLVEAADAEVRNRLGPEYTVQRELDDVEGWEEELSGDD